MLHYGSACSRSTSKANISLSLVVTLLFVACSPETQPSVREGSGEGTNTGQVSSSAPLAPPHDDKVLRERARLVYRLQPLTSEDIEAASLSGELGCTFSKSDAAPILVAMGNVASQQPAQGMIKVGDAVKRVSTPGGFDVMLSSSTFTGPGISVRISLTGAPIGEGESPPRAAKLSFKQGDEAVVTIEGQWTCGP